MKRFAFFLVLMMSSSMAAARGEVFYDDFNRGYNTYLGPDWYESGDAIMSDGIVRARQDGVSVITVSNFNVYDVNVQATFNNSADPNGRLNTSVAVFARSQGNSNGYLGRFVRTGYNNGVVQIVKLGGNYDNCISYYDGCVLAETRVSRIDGRIELSAYRDILSLYVDGRRSLTARDGDFAYGGVGIRFNGWYGPLADDFVAEVQY